MRTSRVDLPPLAFYKSREEWVPQYGDYIVWSKWVSTWHGVVVDFDGENGLQVIFGGMPFLLFTMSEEVQKKETRTIKLTDIKRAGNGKYAIQQFDEKASRSVWYI